MRLTGGNQGGRARLHVVAALAIGLVHGDLPPPVEAGLVQELHARALLRVRARLIRQDERLSQAHKLPPLM
jgi:hypothetical protein